MEHLIRLDKKKQIIGIIIAAAFTTLGIIIIVNPYFFGYMPFKKSWLFACGLTLVIIFTFVIFFLISKLTKTQHGLIINEDGILDQATALKLGLIRWEEMESLSVKREIAARFIVIHLKNPEEFLAKFSGIKKSTIKKNAESLGSPAAISTAILALKFDEVKQIVADAAQKKGIMFN